MDEDIKKAVEVLKAGGTILYPTDTIWGVGCDPTNPKAVQKLMQIKNRPKEYSFIILLEDSKKITDYVEEVPDILWDLIDSFDAPTTIIYPKAKKLAKNVIGDDGSIAIRVVNDDFCKKLITEFGKPIVSSSANFSGEPSPVMFRDISPEFRKKVDYIIQSNQLKLNKVKASTIIRLNLNGEFDIIRY
jgi:L-threonylcarbamoyladenylate synthase